MNECSPSISSKTFHLDVCVYLCIFQIDFKTQKVWFEMATTQSLPNSEFSDSQSNLVSFPPNPHHLKEHPYFEWTSSL